MERYLFRFWIPKKTITDIASEKKETMEFQKQLHLPNTVPENIIRKDLN